MTKEQINILLAGLRTGRALAREQLDNLYGEDNSEAVNDFECIQDAVELLESLTKDKE